ncbi:YveK family protein [Bacillus sp. AK128]
MDNNTQTNLNEKVKEINLKEYFDVIKKRFWILVIVTAVFTLAGYLHSIYVQAPPLYQASKRMVVNTSAEYMSTLLVLVEDPIVLDKVIEELDLDMSSGALAGQLNAFNINDSQVVKVTATNFDSDLALKIVNTTVAIFQNEIKSLLGFTDMRIIPETREEGQITAIYQDNDRTLLALGIGIIAGIGLIFLLDSLDNSVRTRTDVEKYLGLPLVGVVSSMNKRNIAPKREDDDYDQEIEIRGESINA